MTPDDPTDPAAERIWAPWRIGYVKKAAVPDTGEDCIFCTKPVSAELTGADGDRENLIVHRGTHCFVMLNLYPYTSGHLMVAPFAHVGSLPALDSAAAAEMMALTQHSISALEKTHTPHAFNVGMNQGRAAGAGVEHHIHMHVVPRWNGDNNFMPVLADTRVIPQDLNQTWQLINEEFAN